MCSQIDEDPDLQGFRQTTWADKYSTESPSNHQTKSNSSRAAVVSIETAEAGKGLPGPVEFPLCCPGTAEQKKDRNLSP